MFVNTFNFNKKLINPIFDGYNSQPVISNYDFINSNNVFEQQNKLAYLEATLTALHQEIKANETKNRLILDSCVIPLAVIDINERFDFINEAACQMLGYRADELIGSNACKIFNLSNDVKNNTINKKCPITAALHQNLCNHSDQICLRHANGSNITVAYVIQSIVEKEKIVGAIINFWSVTDSTLIFPKSNPDAKLNNEQLTYLSHEIRTPLNTILGLAKIGKQESSDIKSQEIFSYIEDAGQILFDTINNILDFSKIESGKLKLNLIPFSPQKLIERTINIISPQAIAKELILNVVVSHSLPVMCIGDDFRLFQILVNFLNNAVKFTSKGSITLYLEWRDSRLIFKITDTGIGMTTEQINKLFVAFEQANASIASRFGGTGLGLFISKKLIDLMGGDIKVSSNFGTGTSFEISIPAPLSQD